MPKTLPKPLGTKAPAKSRRKTSVLTEKQGAYVEARLDGKSKKESALLAGFSPNSPPSHVEQSDDVRAALAEARSELSSAAQLKRLTVVEMFQEAYQLAKFLEEPASMVGAAREIGKMLGFYEPEKIKVEMTIDQAILQKKYEVMSDEQLLEIANGSASIIEGDYRRLS